ncbi:MAG: 4-(cytidine 5'-diphospho)-2-C-methyl-D-erythritol kinase [Thermomicrobiales bacterium]|nr:4-(cytidine 5'-diphospho)-2-C-methyl-D-erythritol kinase [Thermomicrobiales bacterium]
MRVLAHAPAKINLGLEVLGKRADGYHEIRTIFAAVGLYDRLTVTPATNTTVRVDRPELENDQNLVNVAASLLSADFPAATARFDLEKRIPAAAGLGGASSDAAATLIALNHLHSLGLSNAELRDYAVRIGSDVPFFVEGGFAHASGRGEILTPLPTPRSLYAVIVSPNIDIPRKTATLYGALRPSDFTDGLRIEASARALAAGDDSDVDLGNVFERALYDAAPALGSIAGEMRRAGAKRVGLSGAGPSHYALERDEEAASAIVDRLRHRLNDDVEIGVYALVSDGVTLRTV